MLLQLTDDQAFFRETTERFLTEMVPVGEVRRLRHDPAGYQAAYWRRGAELGWTSLLVGEDHGGGSISGDGLADLMLVAHEFGRHAAPGPLAPTNVVAGALARGGSHPEIVARLLTGTTVATWAHLEGPPDDGLDGLGFEIRRDGDELVLDGVKRPVESADQASHLLVSGRTGDAVTQVLIPADAPGLELTPMRGIDLSRRFFVATMDGVRVSLDAAVGEIGGASADVERQFLQTLLILNAESVGAMQRAFEMTVEWAFERYSFGRPLASYQALKHRFATMKCWLEAGHAINDEAMAAASAGVSDAAERASAAKAFIGEYGGELMQDCVQLHGGIGVTFEHDLHLYMRRLTVNRAIFGTPDWHRRRLAALVIERETAPPTGPMEGAA